MPDTLTQPDTWESAAAEGRSPPTVLALIVVWCSESTARTGELLLPPPGDPGPWRLFGRGSSRPEDPQPRLDLLRDHPGNPERTPPLQSPKLSREQFVLRARANEAIELRNLGRANLVVNDRASDTALLCPDDVVQVGSQLLLFCVRRPAWIPACDHLPQHPFGTPDRHGIVGESPLAWQIRRQIAFCAPLSDHVLVTGASGTGKELVARAVHDESPRARRPLVSRNAATFPETLIDAELFGNVKNYPNPGMPERPGLIGEANGSTLFLDEIGELPAPAQAHLLRVLDRGEYQRLGETRQRVSDVRFIVATNHVEGLRHDFLPRLKLRVDLPDLNARREDVPLIAQHLLRSLAERNPDACRMFSINGSSIPRLSLGFTRALVMHSFVGNVREVETFLWQAIQERHAHWLECPRSLRATSANTANGAASLDANGGAPPTEQIDPRSLDSARVQACLDQNQGSIERTWRVLGLSSRHALARIIKRHGLRTR